MQEQTACPFIFRHWLFEPQGDGLQGSWTGGAVTSEMFGNEESIYPGSKPRRISV